MEKEDKLIHLRKAELIFNPNPIGMASFINLTEQDYGKDYRMPLLPELTDLLYETAQNLEDINSREIHSLIKKPYWQLTGNTLVYFFKQGMFVVDEPSMKNGVPEKYSFKILEEKLGSCEENQVIYSKDKKIRFVPNSFKTGKLTNKEFEKNHGINGIFGGMENSRKLIEIYPAQKDTNPYFTAVNKDHCGETPIIRVPSMTFFNYSEDLEISAVDPIHDADRFTYKVKK